MTPLRHSLPALWGRRALTRSRSDRRVRLSAVALEARDCPAVNLIANPSVETAASSTTPAGWRPDRWGTNAVTFSYPQFGLDGQRSVRVDMTARSSGDAKWYFDEVPVTPGQTYTFSDLYTSNVSTHATLRYRLANGSFTYIGYYPAAAGTARALSFNFTPPANTVSATVFHVIQTPGFLVTDRFSLSGPDVPAPDATAPTVVVTAPAAGATVSGTIDLAAQATDNVGVASVRFFVDGNPLGAEDTAAPYQASLDTTTLTNGSHSITAVARDAAGNSVTSAAVTVTVANGATPTPTNLIQNPSFETLGDNGDPIGWTRNGWGTNSPSYSLVPGTDAARAARVDMTSYSSGDAKWVFADVPVSPSTTYTFSDSYRSNVSTQLVIQYRLSNGSLSYIWITDLAPAESWTNVSYQVTTPAAATAMTIFHLIHSVGWLETDRFALTAAAPGGGGGGGTPRPGMISLTFDDGWLSQLENAVPVVQQADLPASFYVITRANQGGQAWELVQNRSLETAAPTSDAAVAVPVGWNTYRTGTNATTFNYATTGAEGSRSARIDVTSHTSGDAAWYFRDVAVQGGTQYTLSHQYNATVPTSLLVRFTNHNGDVSWMDLGALSATSGQWQTRQLTVTAPANADAMTVLHRISRVGTLWTDDYSVKPVNPFSNPSYMTPSQIQGLQSSGFEVGSHTLTHADLTSLSAAGARAEIEGSRADLIALGITPTTFVYPYGEFNSAIRQMVVDAGYVAARSVNEGYNTGTTDRFALMHQEVNLGTTPADVQGWIDTAEQNGTWLILTFHQVDHSGGEYSTTPETFRQIVTMVTAADLDPVTVAEGVARL